MMSHSASDIGEGPVVGFKNLYEFVKNNGASLFVFSDAGVKRKGNKNADRNNHEQYGNHCGASKSFH
jgi:hypothetical protein